MLIQELTNDDNLNLLAHMHFGRIACAQGAQPYVVLDESRDKLLFVC